MKSKIFGVLVIVLFSGMMISQVGAQMGQGTEEVQSSISDLQNTYSDQGAFEFIVAPLHDLLVIFYSMTGNLGWAIVLLTLGVKLVMAPIQFYAIKGAKEMERIQPLVKVIKDKFKDDVGKQRIETLELFKREKVRPFASILPALFSIPIFFSLFEIFRKTPLSRGAFFFGWMSDLSSPDPLFILPVIGGGVFLASILYGGRDKRMSKKLSIALASLFTIFMVKMPIAVLIYSITSSSFSLMEKMVVDRIL